MIINLIRLKNTNVSLEAKHIVKELERLLDDEIQKQDQLFGVNRFDTHHTEQQTYLKNLIYASIRRLMNLIKRFK